MSPVAKRWLIGLFVLVDLGLLALVGMFLEARRMPVIRRATVDLPGLPATTPPLRIALMTDTHMSGPDNSPERLGRIVDRINAERPDLVLLGGDYIGDPKLVGPTYGPAASVAPFARLRARLGVFAVMGNHDGGAGPAKALAGIGVRVLRNQAIQAGPIVLGGLDDPHIGRQDIPATLRAMASLPGARILLTHGPDAVEKLDGSVPLVLAGHNHCGQIALPWIGALWVPSRSGTDYACGLYHIGQIRLVVSGGVGTSFLPLRAFAPPEFWIITLTPPP